MLAQAQDGTLVLPENLCLVSTLTIPAGTTLTIDLAGHELSTSLKKNSTTNHLYAISNRGTLTITDSRGGGSIVSRGIENFDCGTLTLESGRIVAQDANGGMAVWSMGTFVMKAGSLEVTHEGSTKDNSGPMCLQNLGSATITGGTIASANRASFALISSGELTLEPEDDDSLTVSGPHGALQVTGGTATISGGSYQGTESAGALEVDDPTNSAEAPKVTVNGGDFSGIGHSVEANHTKGDPVFIANGAFHQSLKAASDSPGFLIGGGTFAHKPDESQIVPGNAAFEEGDVYVVKHDLGTTGVSVTVTLNQESATYTGEALVPDLTVIYGDVTLDPAKDYQVTGKLDGTEAEIVAVGSYELTVSGKGAYYGTAATKPTFTVQPASLENAIVTLSPSSLVADGASHEVIASVTLPGVLVTADDYTTTITNEAGKTVSEVKDPGTYNVQVEGKNNCTGKAPAAKLQVSAPAEGIPETTEVTDPTTGDVTTTTTRTSLDGSTTVSSSTVAHTDGSKETTESYAVTSKVGDVSTTSTTATVTAFASDGSTVSTTTVTSSTRTASDGTKTLLSEESTTTYADGRVVTLSVRPDGSSTTVETRDEVVREAHDGQPAVVATVSTTTLRDAHGAEQMSEARVIGLRDAGGNPASGWQWAGHWYHANQQGVADVGEQLIDGETFVFEADGTMKVGWHDRSGNGNWIVLNPLSDGHQGAMLRSQWFNDNGWYLLDDDGSMLRGTQVWHGEHYLLDAGGRMLTGWQWLADGWHYYGVNGAMLRNTMTPDGFWVDANGRWVA